MKRKKGYRKNHIARTSMLLLCLVVISILLCLGLFARYKTTATSDSGAKVAHFGTTFVLQGELFSENTSLSAGSSNPTGIIFYPTGKAETAIKTKCSLRNTGDYGDICISRGYYHIDYGEKTIIYIPEADHTEQAVFDDNGYRFCLHVEEDFKPIVYTLKSRANASSSWQTVSGLNGVGIETIKNWLVNTYSSTYAAGHDFSQDPQYQLTWEWPAGSGQEGAEYDAMFSMLLTANTEENDITFVNTPESFSAIENVKLELNMEQID